VKPQGWLQGTLVEGGEQKSGLHYHQALHLFFNFAMRAYLGALDPPPPSETNKVREQHSTSSSSPQLSFGWHEKRKDCAWRPQANLSTPPFRLLCILQGLQQQYELEGKKEGLTTSRAGGMVMNNGR